MTKKKLAEHVIHYIEKEYWQIIDLYPDLRDAFEEVIQKAKAIVEKEV